MAGFETAAPCWELYRCFRRGIISLFTDHLVNHKNQMKDLADFEQKIYFAIKDCDSHFYNQKIGIHVEGNCFFHYRNSAKVFGQVKWYVEERLRTHLRRRFKLHSRAQAYHHLPTAALYGRYGLFKIPTTAGWRKAHALQ